MKIDNGGDGLVAARHMKFFGYKPAIYYPKQPDRQHLKDLVKQSIACDIPFIEAIPDDVDKEFDLVIDAIFGFSFKGDIREPFLTAITKIKQSGIPIVSVDVPSGWNVDLGDTSGGKAFSEPQVRALVSLTAPKLCAAEFKGVHYLGGRFVPDSILEKYKCRPPVHYQGSA